MSMGGGPVAELRRVAKIALDHGGQRGPLLREYAFRAARRVTPAVVASDGELRFLVDTQDEVIGRVTFMYRGFDEAAMRRALDELARRTGRPEPLAGRTILDVGGNLGTTSVYAVCRFGAARAIAFEPAPENVRLLKVNAVLNGVEDRVEIEPVAVSDRAGRVTLALSAENSGDHRVGSTPEAGARGAVEVPAVALDDLVAAGRIDPAQLAVLWIDVQGHEAAVLRGAGTLVDAGVPVVMEYWPAALRESGELGALHALVGERFSTVVDLGHPNADAGACELPGGDLAPLAARLSGAQDQTDLLLLP